ncbi:hypothetical protein EVAR_64034_1 [Eumeta japonica]|uniref:Pre-C2HC domain-containing protein n=1 Tax=Eumeta variegata TaxID=151549 RepID=A0A4C1Z5B9_EUMVA|nr:hypothetical protein EVAR_64034_1 [Eumeta japonica]
MRRKKNINFSQARSSAKGLKLQAKNVTECRNLQNLLVTQGFHTYSLKEEYEIRIVLKGVPKKIPVKKVKVLRSLNFPVQAVRRILNRAQLVHPPASCVKRPHGHLHSMSACSKKSPSARQGSAAPSCARATLSYARAVAGPCIVPPTSKPNQSFITNDQKTSIVNMLDNNKTNKTNKG